MAPALVPARVAGIRSEPSERAAQGVLTLLPVHPEARECEHPGAYNGSATPISTAEFMFLPVQRPLHARCNILPVLFARPEGN